MSTFQQRYELEQAARTAAADDVAAAEAATPVLAAELLAEPLWRAGVNGDYRSRHGEDAPEDVVEKAAATHAVSLAHQHAPSDSGALPFGVFMAKATGRLPAVKELGLAGEEAVRTALRETALEYAREQAVAEPAAPDVPGFSGISTETFRGGDGT